MGSLIAQQREGASLRDPWRAKKYKRGLTGVYPRGLESLSPCQVTRRTGSNHSIPTMRLIYVIFAVIITQRIRAIIIHFIVR
jgi:hypothetical protein